MNKVELTNVVEVAYWMGFVKHRVYHATNVAVNFGCRRWNDAVNYYLQGRI